MISLDQIQLLEQKVELAVKKISELQKENDFLRSEFSALKVKSDELQKTNVELQNKVTVFESDQPRIEQGIINALKYLDNVEDSVLNTHSQNEPFAESVSTPAPQKQTPPVQPAQQQPQISPIEQQDHVQSSVFTEPVFEKPVADETDNSTDNSQQLDIF